MCRTRQSVPQYLLTWKNKEENICIDFIWRSQFLASTIIQYMGEEVNNLATREATHSIL